MGGMSAASSISRVIDAHGKEIQKELEEQVPESLRTLFKSADLEHKNYGIQVWWEFEGGNLEGPLMDIDDLAERYPDCEVGY